MKKYLSVLISILPTTAIAYNAGDIVFTTQASPSGEGVQYCVKPVKNGLQQSAICTGNITQGTSGSISCSNFSFNTQEGGVVNEVWAQGTNNDIPPDPNGGSLANCGAPGLFYYPGYYYEISCTSTTTGCSCTTNAVQTQNACPSASATLSHPLTPAPKASLAKPLLPRGSKKK